MQMAFEEAGHPWPASRLLQIHRCYQEPIEAEAFEGWAHPAAQAPAMAWLLVVAKGSAIQPVREQQWVHVIQRTNPNDPQRPK